MCGRYTLIQINKIDPFPKSKVPAFDSERFQPRFNICPSQSVDVILNDGTNKVVEARWGLIPSWAKDPAIGNSLANARSEGIESKPSFRSSFKRRRCAVLADGFYEWANRPGEKLKIPYYFHLNNKSVFGFAGLWDIWRDPTSKAEILSCCLITTSPNEVVEPVHDRMPVILQTEFVELWLSPDEQPVDRLKSCLVSYPSEEMRGYMVSRVVNKPQNNSPDCIAPVDPHP